MTRFAQCLEVGPGIGPAFRFRDDVVDVGCFGPACDATVTVASEDRESLLLPGCAVTSFCLGSLGSSWSAPTTAPMRFVKAVVGTVRA